MDRKSDDHFEETAVDDVRKVRELIAQQHQGGFQAHIEETNRVTAQIIAELGLKVIPAPTHQPAPKRSGG